MIKDMIKKYESYGEPQHDWRKESLQIRELFYSIEENVWDYGGNLDFQFGIRGSYNSYQWPCYLKNEEILGDTDWIDKSCKFGQFCVRITINPNFDHRNSPFQTSENCSFFGENANKLLDIMMQLNLIKKSFLRHVENYTMAVSVGSRDIHVNFLRDK